MKNILINYMGRNNSGPLIALEIAKALKKLDYGVYVVISKYISNRADWDNCGFDDIYEVETYQAAKELPFCSLKFVLAGKSAIKRHFAGVHIDAVIKPFSHPWAELITDIFKDAKVITYCHDPIMHSGVGKFQQMMYRKHIKNSNEIVVLTKSFAPIVAQNYGFSEDKVHYAPHGKLGMYKEKQSTTCPDKAFEYDKSNINFMFFGRIQEYKGLHVLAKAFRILKKRYSNITLTVIGSGDFAPYQTDFDGVSGVRIVNRYIADEEVGWCFTGENLVTVLPYIDATQSGVVPIAMEYGVPIIATNTGGLLEQLFGGEIGVLCEASNEKDLADKMEKFITNPELFIEQKELMARKMKDLEWDVIIKKLMDEISGV